ncbi:hypothetical protein MSIMFB_03507 [Mycobacterium simulans]|uniref:Polyketide cyclase / dehydrase and lipid transport family protein n=1 Tax=Mycobacterium simulans TaxID=627089 RepID=A0A7Z7NAM8_9MYCO|nr:hypothetical protein MSIMFB_03507 [Mycobacterium simulans]
MVEIHLERTIAAPVEQVFDWLADPVNLATAPLALRAGYAKDSSPPGAGAVREVVGVGMRFREEITAYERPHITPTSSSIHSRRSITKAAR